MIRLALSLRAFGALLICLAACRSEVPPRLARPHRPSILGAPASLAWHGPVAVPGAPQEVQACAFWLPLPAHLPEGLEGRRWAGAGMPEAPCDGEFHLLAGDGFYLQARTKGPAGEGTAHAGRSGGLPGDAAHCPITVQLTAEPGAILTGTFTLGDQPHAFRLEPGLGASHRFAPRALPPGQYHSTAHSGSRGVDLDLTASRPSAGSWLVLRLTGPNGREDVGRLYPLTPGSPVAFVSLRPSGDQGATLSGIGLCLLPAGQGQPALTLAVGAEDAALTGTFHPVAAPAPAPTPVRADRTPSEPDPRPAPGPASGRP